MFSILALVCICLVGQLHAQLCYPYTNAAGTTDYYTCKDKIVIPCTTATDIGPRAGNPVDCTSTDALKFGGSAVTDFCYPNQETLSICGPKPPCPTSGSYPISNRGSGCKSYYICVETNAAAVSYKVIAEVCPGTQNFNPATRRCDENYKCSALPPPSPCTFLRVEEDPNSCRKYRKCILGQWQTMTCPFNFRYSTTLRICMPQFAVTCGTRPT